jgi:uncharacterized membrane protein
MTYKLYFISAILLSLTTLGLIQRMNSATGFRSSYLLFKIDLVLQIIFSPAFCDKFNINLKSNL